MTERLATFVRLADQAVTANYAEGDADGAFDDYMYFTLTPCWVLLSQGVLSQADALAAQKEGHTYRASCPLCQCSTCTAGLHRGQCYGGPRDPA